MFMKNKNRFSSYSEAFKKLEFLRGQENLQEATKYVLKQAAPAQAEAPAPEAPVAEPSMDVAPDVSNPVDPSEPVSTASSNDMGDAPNDANMGDDAQGDEATGKRSDYMAEVQKYAGK
jgi:hypothetical protein